VSAVDKKQQPPVRPGLEDPNWLPIGDDDAAWIAQDMAIRGLRIAYRKRGDPHCELTPLDPRLPPEGQSNLFYYSWGPDHSKLASWWWEEEERLRERLRPKGGRQGEEAVARHQPRKPGPKPRYDWPTQVARHLINLIRSGKPEPTPQEMAQHCVDTLGYEPDFRELQKLLKKLLD